MQRDFKNWILLMVFGLPVVLILFIAALYFGSCGASGDGSIQNCSQASLPPLVHTPIPTLIPVANPLLPPGGEAEGMEKPEAARCLVAARRLLAAWVTAGAPEKEAFDFTDIQSRECQATFMDVQPLFMEANLWYTGAPACASCHYAEVKLASAGMDLSSYAGILAGSQRVIENGVAAVGNSILGDWEKSKLNEMLFVVKKMPLGRPEGAVAEEGPTIQAGKVK